MNESSTAPPAFVPVSRLRAALNIVVFFTVLTVITALYVVVCLLLLWNRRYRIYSGNLYGKIIGATVLAVTGIKPMIRNKERIAAGGAVFVCNHTATIDMWVGMWVCPFGGCGTAKREIVRIPIFGLAYLLSGHLLVDRSNKERAIVTEHAG